MNDILENEVNIKIKGKYNQQILDSEVKDKDYLCRI